MAGFRLELSIDIPLYPFVIDTLVSVFWESSICTSSYSTARFVSAATKNVYLMRLSFIAS